MIVKTLFSAPACAVVATLAVGAIWWHALTMADTIEAQETVANDCLAALPWLLAAGIRLYRSSGAEKGGES